VNLLAANLVASLLSYLAATLIAVWYLAPALMRRPLAEALTILAWVQGFRYVALQIFSASDVAGLEASLATQSVIALGDLATAVLALVALMALRRGAPAARPLMWVLAIVGTADLISATVTGVAGRLADTASGWSRFILAFYVPALWVAEVLTFWQLIARRRESMVYCEQVSEEVRP